MNFVSIMCCSHFHSLPSIQYLMYLILLNVRQIASILFSDLFKYLQNVLINGKEKFSLNFFVYCFVPPLGWYERTDAVCTHNFYWITSDNTFVHNELMFVMMLGGTNGLNCLRKAFSSEKFVFLFTFSCTKYSWGLTHNACHRISWEYFRDLYFLPFFVILCQTLW